MTENNQITLKKQTIKDLTSSLFHKHYCENDVEAIIELFDDKLSWFGAAENEYAVGTEKITNIFRQFAGMVPKCKIWDEEYDVIDISSDVYVCSGRAWIATDPSSNMYLCAHQRITAVFHWINNTPCCCHIHISNPYSEMTEQDIGFPTQMGKQSYEYLNQSIDQQKRIFEEETKLLQKISYEDSLTGLFNRNKFNSIIDVFEKHSPSKLGIAYIDLNELKKINDKMGHSAGDNLIRCTAYHITYIFPEKAYRIGGDEFVIIDTELDEDQFTKAISKMKENIKNDGIKISLGISWRDKNCNIKQQCDEADSQMYKEKAIYYNNLNRDK